MATYKDLMETLIRREMGIVGKDKALAVAREAGLPVSEDGGIMRAGLGVGDLDRLVKAFGERFGFVAVVGCKVALMRLARDSGLELPESLRV